jgi:Holliday junction DNA helicase RuvA
MISRLKGVVLEKSPTRIVLEVNGLGYEIHIPVSTFEKVPAIGERTQLFTHLHVREDLLQLYGFWDESEKKMFQLLISISGVGPRMALGVLSGISVDSLSHAVTNNNISVLTQIPGVGKKTAQRLVMELKDKLGQGVEVVQPPGGIPIDIIDEAITALVSLGYRQGDAQKIINQVIRKEKQVPSIELLIKKALQTLISPG